MATRFYKKELVSTKLWAANGAPINFINVGDDTGVLKTDSDYLINQLDSAIARSVGGVIPIDEETYNDLEKKSNGSQLVLNSQRDRFSLSAEMLAPGIRSHLGAAEVGKSSGLSNTQPVGFDQPKEPVPPLEVQETFQKPVVKRAYRKRGTDGTATE